MKFVVAFRELPDWMFEEIFSAGAPVLICWFCCYSQACASISLSRCSHWGWSWCWRILSGIWTVFFAVRRTPIAFRVGNPFRFIKRCFNHKNLQTAKLAGQGTCCNHPSQMFPPQCHSHRSPIPCAIPIFTGLVKCKTWFLKSISNSRRPCLRCFQSPRPRAGPRVEARMKKTRFGCCSMKTFQSLALTCKEFSSFFTVSKKNVKRISAINSCLAKSFSQYTSDFCGTLLLFQDSFFGIWKVNFLISFILIKTNITNYSKNKYICNTIFFPIFFLFFNINNIFFNFWNYFLNLKIKIKCKIIWLLFVNKKLLLIIYFFGRKKKVLKP